MRKGFMGYRGGDEVRFGFYWNMTEWAVQIVPKEGGVLKGSGAEKYMRLPLVVLLTVAPLMGAVYAFFLPFIGFAMVVMYLAGRLGSLFRTTPPAAEVTPEGGTSATRATKHAA